MPQAPLTHSSSPPPTTESRKRDGIKAIGHITLTGGVAACCFRLAFKDAAHQWTPELCAADSDSDGQTGGQELGDPCCQWVLGTKEKVSWSTDVSYTCDANWKSDASL